MATPTVYVICDQNCKFEGMTKEQILTAIADATGSSVVDVDAAFITKLKEQNKGTTVKLWMGTQAEYNELSANGGLEEDTLYFTSDGCGMSNLQDAIEQTQANMDELDGRMLEADERMTAIEDALGTNASAVVPIIRGGTGATSAAAARSALGAAAANHTHSASNITSGELPVERGGTGATEMVGARANLGIYEDEVDVTLNEVATGVYSGSTTVTFGFSGSDIAKAHYFATVVWENNSGIIASINKTDTNGVVHVDAYFKGGTGYSNVRCTVSVLAVVVPWSSMG